MTTQGAGFAGPLFLPFCILHVRLGRAAGGRKLYLSGSGRQQRGCFSVAVLLPVLSGAALWRRISVRAGWLTLPCGGTVSRTC